MQQESQYMNANQEAWVHQQELYHAYAEAVEAYARKPTLNNWEKKEEAFETFNASLSRKTYLDS